MKLVVDASVALRWFVDAPGAAVAGAVLEGEDPLLAPDLVVAEVANAAWKLVRGGQITEEHGSRIAGAVASTFSALTSCAKLSSQAFALARQLDHPVYDCLYLALAESEKASLVTADRRLARKLRGTAWSERVQLLKFK